MIKPKLAPGAVLVMDDINDNTFFKCWVETEGLNATVFAFGGKYIGVVGI